MIQRKTAVCHAALRSYQDGLFAGTSGNLSTYDSGSGQMAITPSGVDYLTMQPSDVVIMGLDGTIHEGTRPPSSEWRLHAAIYQAKPEAGAVVHTHSPYATSFAVVRRPIPAVLIEMLVFLGGDVPVADFALPGTAEVGTHAVAALTDRTACLMANHGVVAFGRDLSEARTRAIYVEDAAKICTLAQANGTPIVLSGEIQQQMLALGAAT